MGPCEIQCAANLTRYLILQLYFIFKVKASHAAAALWEVINALDAVVACYRYIIF